VTALLPARADIEAAASRISGHVRRTPILELLHGIGDGAAKVTLKLDLLQPTGSFKVRGAFSRLLGVDPAPQRVVAASGGNFGLAVAYAAAELGMAADIFVPESSPPAKVDRLRRQGAAVHVIPGHYADALEASKVWIESNDALFAHAYDQFDVVAGQGTCGMEMATQIPGADSVLVAVGGGGLIAGIASWYRNDVTVIGVETEGTPTLHKARRTGGPVDVEVGGLAVSSLGSKRLGDIAWEVSQRWIDDSILVSDEATAAAQHWLWEHCRLAVEPGAATPVAALLSGAYRPAAGEHVAVLVCGANVDPGSVLE
jgi:threonine dehydratase